MTTFVEFRLLDPDLQTVHGILPFQKGDLYLQLNEPGSGSVKTALDIASAALVESGGFIEGHYRAALRGGFFIENSGESDVTSGEEAGRALEISGRGALALLEDAVVWTDGSGANKRTFSGTQAAMLITLIEEAQTRGGLGIVDWDFTATEDSDGETWTDDFPLELTVGMTLLDVIRQIAKTGIDFDILPDGSGNYVLSAYKLGIGSDKSETVYFRMGVNCTEVSHSEAGGSIRNALLVKYKNGYTSVQDATSITARRRRESVLNYDFVQRPDSAVTFASAELQGKKDPKRQISVKIYDGAGPRAFVDYSLGDTITLDQKGVEEEYRVRGIHLSWTDNGYAEVIVDLNSMILENEIRVTQDLDWLLNEWKTAHDAGLLEVKFWAAIGDRSISYTAIDIMILGDYLYLTNNSVSLLKYDLVNGGWVVAGVAPEALRELAYVGSDIYVTSATRLYKFSGGTFTEVGRVTDTGSPGTTFIFTIAAIGTKIYVGGAFDYVTTDSLVITGIAEYDTVGDSWADIGGSGTYGALVMVVEGSNLYVGAANQVYKWNGSWSTVGAAFSLSVLSLAVYGTGLLAGVADTGHLFEWNGSSWSLFGGGVNGNVYSIGVYLTDVYIGGAFTDAGSKVSRYSGGQWWDLAGGVNNTVTGLVLNGDDLIVIGTFTVAGDKSAQGIAEYFTNFASLADYLEHASGTFNLGEAIHAAVAKTSLTGADEMPLWDSLTGLLRKITWTNIIASIKTWADTIYVALTGNQIIAGTKTFSSFPVTPSSAPTSDYEVANKKYVDDNAGGGGSPGGSDTEVQFNDGGAFGGETNFTYDKTTGELHVGPSDRGVRLFGEEGDISQYAPDGENPVITQHAWQGAPAILSFVAEGTLASQAAVTLGKVLWQVTAKAFNGTDFKDAGRIRAVVTEDHDGTSSGMKWEVYCVPNGSNTEVLVATIDADGSLVLHEYGSGAIAGTATYNLAVNSSGKVIEVPASISPASDIFLNQNFR